MDNYLLGFFIDNFHHIKTKTDTSLAMMLEAQKRGYRIGAFQSHSLALHNGVIEADISFIEVADKESWYKIKKLERLPLNSFHTIFFRKDPPFDQEYLYSTYLLEFAERQGVRIINRPSSIRRFNEKLFASYFPEFIPPTLVTASLARMLEFINAYEKTVIKPLNGLAGQNIYLLEKHHPNTKALLLMLSKNESESIMIQRYLPEVLQGDKRIIILNGEPVPYALLRIPQTHDFRANLAAGGSAKIVKLNDRDREMCARLKPILQESDLNLVGIDVIGDYLTEINVTSPTGIRVLESLKPMGILAKFFDELF